MHAIGKLGRKHSVNHSVTLDPIFSTEGFRHDGDAKMRLAAGARAGMTRMLVRFVNHGEILRRESARQLIRDGIAYRHGHLQRLY